MLDIVTDDLQSEGQTEREILFFDNYDLDQLVTPMDAERFNELLVESGYDDELRREVIQGFKEGFDLGYEGPQTIQQESPNLRFRVGDEIDLWNKVMKEVKLKRYAGPFAKPPYQSYIQSPIGLVPKDGGKDTRLIFHLSYLRTSKGRRCKTSINANTLRDKCSVRYPDFDNAIQLCLEAGKNCKLGRSDVRSAFRNLGI